MSIGDRQINSDSQPVADPARCNGILRVLVVALSLSIGWGIRGNFGHEIGAMLPGALAAVAVVLLSGRADWHRRVAYFATAGALGWSAGGSMSYMQVIAYTHSGHSATVLYGFACLFALGFLWAAPGGAATAIPALVTREQLTSFAAPIIAVAVIWSATVAGVTLWDRVDVDFRQESPLYWYDTDWLGALGVIVAVLGLAAVRRQWDFASTLLMHAAIGWWIAFLLLVPGLGLRMTPPRGDNWAGAIGIVAGLLVFFRRRQLPAAIYATIATGTIGGVGFAGATLIKLGWIATGLSANWHSVLEQSYGFINGIGVAIVMFRLARLTPPVSEDPPVRAWTEPWAVGFAMLGVTYLNVRQNVEVWVHAKLVPPLMYGISAVVWHEVAWALIGLAFIAAALVHRRRPLALVPASWLGRGQLIYLVLLWGMVGGNFLRELPVFAQQRLVTEGVVHLNAILCTMGVLVLIPTTAALIREKVDWATLVKRSVLGGAATAVTCTVLLWAGVRALYGDKPADSGRLHIRFGPNANATIAKPPSGQPHP